MRRVVTELDPDALEPGRHELWLHLVDDELGQPMLLPVLVVKGKRPGPKLGLTAAVHGDEVNGIAVIHALFAKLEPSKLRGTVLAIPVVNVPAYNEYRFTCEGEKYVCRDAPFTQFCDTEEGAAKRDGGKKKKKKRKKRR